MRLKKKTMLVVGACLFSIWFRAALFPSQEKDPEKLKMDKLFKMSIAELQNVKITTAGKHPERIGDIPASVVLITREDIETYGYQSLTEILENIPGLFAINDYSDDRPNFGVRGFWSGVANDNMIILVNGVHQVNDFHSNYPMSKIIVPVEAIDRIEVIRGPMSVIYGNGAFFGVINIITNDNSYESVSMVGGGVGSMQTNRLFARASGKTGEFSYVFNAQLFSTDGQDESLLDMAGDPVILATLPVPSGSRTGGRLENNEKYFNFSGTVSGLTFDMSYSEVDREFYSFFPSVANGTSDHITVANIFVKYHKKLSNKADIEGKFTYSQKKDSYRYDFLFPGFYGVEQVESSGWEAEINAFFYPQDNMDITTGLYYRSVLNVSDTFNLPSFGVPSLENNYFFLSDDDEIVTRALFTQVSYMPNDSLRLVAGIRLEQTPKYGLGMIQTPFGGPQVSKNATFDREDIDIIPRLAVLFYLNDDNIFKFLYGKAINRPSFFQNTQNSFDPVPRRLDPESITTLEINYIGKISPKFSLFASVFKNTLNNLITRVVEFDDDLNYETWSDNAGSMVTHGVELTFKSEPVDNFELELSGTLQKTEDKTEGFENIEVAYSPKILGYLKASYRAMNFAVSLTGNYVGAMETYWDQVRPDPDGVIRTGGRIGDRVDGYILVGANLRLKNLFFRGMFLNIRCSNLLDTEVRYPTFTNNEWAVRGTIGAGRTFLVTMGYRF